MRKSKVTANGPATRLDIAPRSLPKSVSQKAGNANPFSHDPKRSMNRPISRYPDRAPSSNPNPLISHENRGNVRLHRGRSTRGAQFRNPGPWSTTLQARPRKHPQSRPLVPIDPIPILEPTNITVPPAEHRALRPISTAQHWPQDRTTMQNESIAARTTAEPPRLFDPKGPL